MASKQDFSQCVKIGFIIPSSNTVAEPITNAFFQSLENVGVVALYTRLRVQTLGADKGSAAQLSLENMIDAARLLTDAEVSAILWCGTSGMWTGSTLNKEHEFAQKVAEEVTTRTQHRPLHHLGSDEMWHRCPT